MSMFDKLVKFALVAILVSALGAAASTAVSFALTTQELRARSETDLVVYTAVDAARLLIAQDMGCDNLSVNDRPRVADSEVLCFDRGAPWVILAYEDAHRFAEALAYKSVATGCAGKGMRHFVLSGLLVFRTTSDKVAAKLARATDGTRFVLPCST